MRDGGHLFLQSKLSLSRRISCFLCEILLFTIYDLACILLARFSTFVRNIRIRYRFMFLSNGFSDINLELLCLVSCLLSKVGCRSLHGRVISTTIFVGRPTKLVLCTHNNLAVTFTVRELMGKMVAR